MKINKVTITGADDSVSALGLKNLQDMYPFVEWGILFSKKEGLFSKRYPHPDQRDSFVKQGLNLSAHFCGWYAKQVLEEENFALIDNLPAEYKRAQLNYNFSFGKFQLIKFFEWVHTTDREIILQYNKSNASVIEKLLKKSLANNLHILFDASGGRGKPMEAVIEPFNQYTGYAGGIDPNNVEKICTMLTARTWGKDVDKNVWIDLESGVRDENDNFSLTKTLAVLDKAAIYISK